MKILSVNAGQPQELKFNGQAQVSGFIKTPIEGKVRISTNSVGDDVRIEAVHATPETAVYAYPFDAYKNWYAQIDFLAGDRGIFGENLTLDQIDESKIFVGDIFQIGEVKLQATLPRIPCASLNLRFQNKNALKVFTKLRRPGVYFRVLQEGYVQAGDAFLPSGSPEQIKVSMMDIWECIMDKKIDKEKMKLWLQVPSMHADLTKWLQKRLEENSSSDQ
jgi:MOSC domain-containing protein YiiM